MFEILCQVIPSKSLSRKKYSFGVIEEVSSRMVTSTGSKTYGSFFVSANERELRLGDTNILAQASTLLSRGLTLSFGINKPPKRFRADGRVFKLNDFWARSSINRHSAILASSASVGTVPTQASSSSLKLMAMDGGFGNSSTGRGKLAFSKDESKVSPELPRLTPFICTMKASEPAIVCPRM